MKLKKYYKMNTAEIFDMTIHIYSKTVGVQVLYSLISGVLTMLIIFIIMFLTSYLPFAPNQNFYNGTAYTVFSIWITFSVSAAFSTGHMHLAKEYYFNGSADFVRALKTTFSRFPIVFTVQLIKGILQIPFYIVAVFVIRAFQNQISFYHSDTWLIIRTLLYLMILILLYSAFSVYLSLTTPVSAFEKKGVHAIYKSFKLIQKQFIKIYLQNLLWLNVACVLVLSVSITVALPEIYLLDNSYNEMAEIIVGLVVVFGIFLWQIFYFAITLPIVRIFRALVYFNLKIIKEGFDISIAIDKLAECDKSGDIELISKQ